MPVSIIGTGLRTEYEAHAHLNVQPKAPQSSVSMPHCEVKAKALRYKKFQVENISWRSLRYAGGIQLQRDGIVCGFRGKK